MAFRVSSITNSNDSVICVGATVLVIQYTWLVVVEISARIHRDTGWLLLDGGFELLVRLWVSPREVRNLDNFFGFIHLAVTILCGVWVVFGELLWVALRILESTRSVASIAATWTSVTVNKLLLWELEKFPSLDEVLTFHWGSWGEGPAWPAMTLILNLVNGTYWNPINWWGKVFSWKACNFLTLSDDRWKLSSESLKFKLCHGRELVVCYGICMV